MKNLTTSLIILFGSISIFAQSDSILFLGNSYTYTSDLPGKFKSLAEGAGKLLFIDSYTPGGKQLSQHYVDAASISKINAHQWNYVVLQEQSQMPLINPNATITNAQNIMTDYIKVNNPCTEVVMYMTWARKEGNSWLTQINYSHDQMATYYEDFYEDIWKYTAGRVSAVGKAFHEATRQGINIYSGDGSHQNADGTYLAACVFYATLYKETPVGLTFSSASSESVKTKLQQIAHDIVMTDLYEHNITKIRWTMSKTSLNVGEIVSFTEGIYMFPFPNNFLWDFEGANTISSTAENPSNIQYDTQGNYDVKLTIQDECGYTESRKLTDTVTVLISTGINDIENNQIFLYPSLVKDNQSITINGHTFEDIKSNLKIIDLVGNTIPYSISQNKINLTSNFKGAAFFHLNGKTTKVIYQ
jgi:hypothetical protein